MKCTPALETFYILMKNSQAPSPTSWSEKLLVVFFVAYAVHQIFRVFHKWDGVVSVRQKELEDLYKRQTLLREGFEELVRRLQGAPSPQAYDTEGNRPKPPPVSAPEDSLAWRDQVRELITLTWPSYAIDEDEGWHERAGCWVGQNTKTQATVGVLCPVTNPSDQDLVDFATYVQRLPETNGMSLVTLCGHAGRTGPRTATGSRPSDRMHQRGVSIRRPGGFFRLLQAHQTPRRTRFASGRGL